jgi:hypothetical protein
MDGREMDARDIDAREVDARDVDARDVDAVRVASLAADAERGLSRGALAAAAATRVAVPPVRTVRVPLSATAFFFFFIEFLPRLRIFETLKGASPTAFRR